MQYQTETFSVVWVTSFRGASSMCVLVLMTMFTVPCFSLSRNDDATFCQLMLFDQSSLELSLCCKNNIDNNNNEQEQLLCHSTGAPVPSKEEVGLIRFEYHEASLT